MKIALKILFTLFIVNIYNCCSSDKCPRYFQLHAEIVNPKENYKIGDTISIVSRFPTIVSAVTGLPRESAGEYNMSGIKWEPLTTIYKIDSTAIDIEYRTIEYVDKAENHNHKYEPFIFSSGDSWLEGEYIEGNGEFNLEFDLIAKKAGIYCLFQGSFLLTSYQDFPGRCSGVGFDVEVIMNNGEDNNIDLLKESPNPHWNTGIFEKAEERFYRAGGYCFRIVE